MLKVGVFGAGSLGKMHLYTWKEIHQTEITGFYEPDDFTADTTKDIFAVNRFSDVNYLIDACDLIDITTPVDDCFTWCEEAIRKGKHVFIEKTLANSIDEAKELVKLIKESNVKFQVGYNERFNPAFAILQTLNPKPAFIEVQNIIPVNQHEPTKNLLYDLMAPDIDIILSIVKSDVKNISATSASVIANDNDIINARIEFNNGCVANITWERLSASTIHQMRFFESGKFIYIDFITAKTAVITGENFHNIKQILKKEIDAENKTKIDESHNYKHNNNSVKLQLEEFRNAVLNNTPPIVSAIDGLRAMEIAYQILQKTKNSY